MSIHFVSYDLRTPGRDYARLYEALRASSSWARPVESVWLVETSQAAGDLRDALREYVDGNDKLIIVELKTPADWATFNISKEVTDWLRSKL